jgi:hypothetical protein
MGGAVDAIADIGLGDIVDLATDVGSIVTDLGEEFITPETLGIAGTAFGVPGLDVAGLGGFDLVGSFAGDASWFDAFNPGSILDNIPSVSDFSLSSITDSLPSLSDIKGLSSTISTDLNGIVSTAKSAVASYQQIAPAVNSTFSALGIQNPINSIIQPVSQVIGLAGSAAGITKSLTSGTVTNFSTNSLVSSGAAALGINPATASSITAKATSLFTTDPNSTNAVDKATGLPINTARAVDEYGLGILTNAESTELLKKAPLVNALVDPDATPAVTNYEQAIVSRDDVLKNLAAAQQSLADNNKAISDAQKNIEEMQQNLMDPTLTRTQQELLETQIDANYATIAEATKNNEQNQKAITESNAALANDQQIITSTDASAINDPTGVLAAEDAALAEQAAAQSDAAAFDRLAQAPTDVFTDEDAALFDQFGARANTSAAVNSTINTIVGSPAVIAGADVNNLVAQARQQQSLRDLRQDKAQASDWRVKLRLAPGATYLYNDPNGAGILDPLSTKTGTDGVIFPYTPSIETAYKANYEPYDLTHSNYRGYFYKGSYIDAVNMRCAFTAQDTQEANYLLAVIHFFRSVTKMFYGQDPERGSPPPLVFLSGLGDYQFNEHPCVVSQFNYTLPPDVDYIRAYSTLDMSTNLLANRTRTSISANPLSYGINRLLNSGLFTGAQPSTLPGGNLPVKNPTYVPTKMEISITLLPMQTRQQVSTQFSLKGFANGNLLKGGFW